MKKLAQVIVLLIINLFISNSYSQNIKIDSLENLLQKHTLQDTLRVNLLNETAFEFHRINLDITLQYATEASELSNRLDYAKGKSKSFYLIGINYFYKSDYPQARDYYQKSLKIAKDHGLNKLIAQCSKNIGSTYLYEGNYPTAIEYYEKSLKIAKDIRDNKEIAGCLNNIGMAHKFQGNYEQAIEYLQKALKIKEDIGDNRKIAGSLNNIGSIFKTNGNYPMALEYYQNALKIYEELEDKNGIATCLNNIGTIHNTQGNSAKALVNYKESLKLREEIGDKKGKISCIKNIGAIYYYQKDYVQALEYFEKALKIAEDIGSKLRIAGCFISVGSIHQINGDYSKALDYFQKSLSIREEIGDKAGICESYEYIGSVYLELKNYTKALDYTLKSLPIANELELLEAQKNIHEQLAIIFEATGINKKALKNYKLYKKLNDSIFNEENIKIITGLEYQYKFDKEKQVIKLEQKRKDDIQKEEAKRQRIVRNLFFVSFILMLMIALVVLRSFLQKRKANTILKAQKKEIEGQNNLIKLNTKMIIQFENDKHELELTNKQKDVELLNINNQLKIKMKNDLIIDLQKLNKSKTDLDTGIQSIINKLKRQISEESKIDILQENIDEIGSDFNNRIKQKFPDLSKSEIEILSYLKLKLSNKEIAIQRNTSSNAVGVILHRLKQKCNIETTNDLKKFIEEF
jgi:tetratricopeptide (TPR) repeat protein/DNA-binding CsgD family transcriptional regulator